MVLRIGWFTVVLSMPRKLSQKELEEYHGRKLVEARLSSDRRIIHAVVNNYEDVVPHVKLTIQTLSYWPANDAIANIAATKDPICKAKAKKKGKRSTAKLLALEDKDSAGCIAKNHVPSRYWSIQDLSITLLCPRLSKISKTVLSPTNLRTMIQWGEAENAKMVLCEILEFLSGQIDGAFKLVGKYRCFDTLDHFIAELTAVRSDRVAQIALPPDWKKHGLCQVVQKGHKPKKRPCVCEAPIPECGKTCQY